MGGNDDENEKTVHVVPDCAPCESHYLLCPFIFLFAMWLFRSFVISNALFLSLFILNPFTFKFISHFCGYFKSKREQMG